MIEVRCNGCGRSMTVDDSLTGGRIACSTCGAELVVPGGQAMPPPLPPAFAGQPSSPPPSPTPQYRGQSIAAFVLGICSIIIPLLGVIAGVLAIIFGILGLKRYRAGKGLAVAGLVLGCVGIVAQIALYEGLNTGMMNARELARKTVCANNLTTLFKAAAIYSNQNNGYLPAEGHWPVDLVIGEYAQAEAFKCPSARKLTTGPGDVPIYYTAANPDEFDKWYAIKYKDSLPGSPGTPWYLLNIRGGVSYGWNYCGIAAPNSQPKTDATEEPTFKKSLKMDLFPAEVVLLAENNTSAEQDKSFGLVSAFGSPKRGPDWSRFNERHDGQGAAVDFNGHPVMYKYDEITPRMWNVPDEAYRKLTGRP